MLAARGGSPSGRAPESSAFRLWHWSIRDVARVIARDAHGHADLPRYQAFMLLIQNGRCAVQHSRPEISSLEWPAARGGVHQDAGPARPPGDADYARQISSRRLWSAHPTSLRS